MNNHSWIRRALVASVVALAAAFAGSSDAHAANTPFGTGNFRRSEVIKATNANPGYAKVMGVATANRNSAPARTPANARIMAVQHGGKVDLVKAPIDKSRSVSRLSAGEARSYGLVTQAAAQRQAPALSRGFRGQVVQPRAGVHRHAAKPAAAARPPRRADRLAIRPRWA